MTDTVIKALLIGQGDADGKLLTEMRDLNDMKSQFVAEASHELRTPLAIVREFVSLVHDEVVGPVNAKQKECLASTIRNCDRMTELIGKMLDLARIEAGKMEISRTKTELPSILRRCCDDFTPKCRARKQELTLDFGEGLPNAYCDGESIVNIMINLLGNACKFTNDGGWIRVSCMQEGQYLCTRVEDNGRGISKEAQENMFQPFYQVERENGPGSKGTGLGLAITKHLVELNGGYMSLSSEAGKGSCFSFMIPVYREELSKRVLIVDDEEIVIQLVSRYLAAAELNLDIKSTQSGMESLIIAGQYKPDLVILDVNMADVGGKTVLELLKQRAPSESCKILMISGNIESLSDFVERGADDCLSKPFSATDLIRKVVSLLRIERRRQ